MDLLEHFFCVDALFIFPLVSQQRPAECVSVESYLVCFGIVTHVTIANATLASQVKEIMFPELSAGRTVYTPIKRFY